MMRREVAWRVFAAEFNSSSMLFKGEEERSPSYIITPLGAMVNRMFIVGTLLENENIGTEEEPMWRGKVSDPTGTFYISAGRFQPEAVSAMSRLEAPTFVAVVGKARSYRPEEGKLYLSVRPEKIVEVDPEMSDMWVLEASKATLQRVEAMEFAAGLQDPTVDQLRSEGFPANVAHGAMKAYQYYGMADLAKYRAMVLSSLKRRLPESEMLEAMDDFGSSPEELILDETPSELDHEELVLGLIDELDVDGRGAAWEEIVLEAGKRKISEVRLEELTNSLLDKGLIYEPVLGKIKRI